MPLSDKAVSAPRAIADWEKKSAIIVGWPSRPDTWRQYGRPAQEGILSFVLALAKNTDEKVLIAVNSQDQDAVNELGVRLNHLSSLTSRVSTLAIPLDDCWMRDIAPIWVNDEKESVRGVCFKFNAWGGTHGGCYQSFENDILVAPTICDVFQADLLAVNFILEGGSISVNGNGTVITTEECLLCANRNPTFTKDSIQKLLATYLGIHNVIWLPFGLLYDSDSDGHVDNMAIFLDRTHVLLSWSSQGGNVERCAAAEQVLKNAEDVDGNSFTIHKVCVPPTITRTLEQSGVTESAEAMSRPVGQKLCASYVNLVQTNRAVFVPSFGFSPQDEKAHNQIKHALLCCPASKHKRVVMVDASEFILAGGSIHCLTCNVPQI